MLRFKVIGEPVPKGSMIPEVVTNGRGEVVYKEGRPIARARDQQGDKLKSYSQALGIAALNARNRAGARLLREGYAEVTIRFYRPRNKGHVGAHGMLLPSAPLRPEKRPDIDKCSRAVLDACTGVLFRDDGQVADLHASEWFAEGEDPPRTEVEVNLIDHNKIRPPVPDGQMELVAA